MQKNYNIFISGLVELFGSYDDEAKKFANKSNSVIARELFYSDSQFSRLINQTASEGEYERANKIISRYKENQDLKNAIKGQRASLSPIDNFLLKKSFLFPLVIAALIASAFLGAKLWPAGVSITDTNPSDTEKNKMDHMLYWAFELSEVKPYTNLEELPDDCNYPCYRLQGKWQLEHEYKLPVFGEQRGFHYVAKEVNMYARCMSEKNNGGKDLEGFEYQKHEIWYDTKEKTY